VERFERAGLTFDVSDAGPDGGEVVVLLHGFPETSRSWDDVLPLLVAGGCRVLAPDQRGYSPAARPAGRRAYVLSELVADALALGTRSGAERFHVAGHDWGAAVAWALAARHPDRVASLTALSAPHPAAMAQAMVRSTQALRSWYVLLIQLPGLPERLFGPRLEDGLRRDGLPARFARTYADALAQPGALTAALNWYRAIPLERHRVGPVTVPTTFVWSTGDRVLTRTAAELTARWVTGPYRVEVLEGLPHWLPETAPGPVAQIVLDRVRDAGGPAQLDGSSAGP
jgi:pimeloyl-ACP methyl ester carboxylesterase